MMAIRKVTRIVYFDEIGAFVTSAFLRTRMSSKPWFVSVTDSLISFEPMLTVETSDRVGYADD